MVVSKGEGAHVSGGKAPAKPPPVCQACLGKHRPHICERRKGGMLSNRRRPFGDQRRRKKNKKKAGASAAAAAPPMGMFGGEGVSELDELDGFTTKFEQRQHGALTNIALRAAERSSAATEERAGIDCPSSVRSRCCSLSRLVREKYSSSRRRNALRVASKSCCCSALLSRCHCF